MLLRQQHRRIKRSTTYQKYAADILYDRRISIIQGARDAKYSRTELRYLVDRFHAGSGEGNTRSDKQEQQCFTHIFS